MKQKNHYLTEQFITEWLTPDVGFVFRSGKVLDDFSSAYQHIEVMETAAFGRVFRLDGYLMTSEADEWFYHENLNHIPAITHPDPRRALIIGGGDGGSARQLLKYPSIEKIVVCELDARVVSMAEQHFASVHQGAFHDPRLELVIADGLQYVTNCQQQFDLIVLDLTDPQGYAEPLYSREFFSDCARLIGEHGLLSLHVGSPQFHQARFCRLFTELKAVFQVVRPLLIPITLYGGFWGMACASQLRDPKRLDADAVEQRLQQRGISGLHYYNGDTHQAALALPNFVRQLLTQTE
ncbi:polyamine aminopropyltransferase [Tolumonas lignilytica]|jgi:Spermidine synthase|uniref:polyamine aminopropyltransferase n=1 Tax=Tolumonas lignilytica TaxID=1283284 RepID=UPI000463EA45|nr:polyamine aminopropyltransferase [Tolumonas lignilytica]